MSGTIGPSLVFASRLGEHLSQDNAPIDEAIDEMRQQAEAPRLDSLSEMGEMESLRLQMAMDRLSKLVSTLSNVMHKASETQDALVQNMK